MNEVEAIAFKLSRAHNIYDVVECCLDWGDLLGRRVRKPLRLYQVPLYKKIVEFKIGEAALGNEIMTLWSRQSGKTETVSQAVLTLGTFYIGFLNEGLKAGLFAPVKSMITHVTRNRLRERYNQVKSWMNTNLGIRQIAGEGITSSLFVLKSERSQQEMYVESLSVSTQADIIGPTFGLMIIEQAELVNAMKLKNDVFPMGAEKGGVRVLTGTTSPYFKNEYFKQAVQRWNPDPRKNKSTADYVEMVDWKQAVKVSVAYRRYVTRERDRMGVDSLEFKTQFGLQWAATQLKFIGWEDLVALQKDYKWNKERLRFFGIDVAKAGDSTVVTIIELDGTDIHIIAWLELEGIDYDKQIPKIETFLRQYKPLRFGYIDVITLGEPVFDMLKRKLWDDVLDKNSEPTGRKKAWASLEGFYGTAPRNHLRNQAMDREFQTGRLHFPKHTRYRRERDRFIDQMLDLERKYTGLHLKLEHPDIKGRHDDYPDSLAYAIYALKDKTFKGGVARVRM